MDGGASVTAKNRHDKEAEIARLHEKTFRAWANSHLRRRNVKIEDSLDKGFHDGLLLITLVEVLTGENCGLKIHKNPEKDIQKHENIAIAIEFLKKKIPNINVGSVDIIDGNLKVILGLMWRLILTFQVENSAGEDDDPSTPRTAAQKIKAAKLKLLQWCKDTTAGHKGVNIENFESSWYDGLAFCALIHAMDPSLIDYDSLSASNAKDNLTIAFDLAEKHFDIPRLLDPEDIIQTDANSRPDEQCFITYISEFPVAMLQHKLKRNEVDEKEKEEKRRIEEEARKKAEDEALAIKIAEAERLAREQAEAEARKREEEAAAKRKREEDERAERERIANEELLRKRKEEEEKKN